MLSQVILIYTIAGFSPANNVRIGLTALYRLPSLDTDEFVTDMLNNNNTTSNVLDNLNVVGHVSQINDETR